MIGNEFSELADYDVRPELVHLLSRTFCNRHRVVVLDADNDDPEAPVKVGMLHPDDVNVQHLIADYLQRRIEPVRLNAWEIERALAIGWGETPDDSDHVVTSTDHGPDASPADLLDHILASAVVAGASDIHLESFQNDVDLRLRIDGILHQAFTRVDPSTIRKVVNRLKVLADLDITEHRRPQDGRIRCRFTRDVLFEEGGEVIETEDRVVDFRISIVPSPAGEDAVIRVLDPQGGLMPLSQLGMPSEIETTMLRLLDNPEGLILVTGPTGSGKTTTLYAALAQVNDGRRKIITAEDPIEYYIPKINQKQVNEQMPMASLLRALLRQDPDVLLVGEVRDLETASTAMAAAATGHVVMGTLHTSDALGAVPRLRGLGVDDADLSDALLAVLAQRLVRRVCPDCAAPHEPSDSQRELFGPLLDGRTPMAGEGCEACHHTGYRGRRGIFELLVVDAELQHRIADGVHAVALADHARTRGFRTLFDAGLDALDAGETSLDELVRVVPYRQIVAARRRLDS